MAKKQNYTFNLTYIIVVVIVAVAAGAFILFSVRKTQEGPGTTQSNAGYNSQILPGDDVLSLEQDLNILGVDKTQDEEVHLNAIR